MSFASKFFWLLPAFVLVAVTASSCSHSEAGQVDHLVERLKEAASAEERQAFASELLRLKSDYAVDQMFANATLLRGALEGMAWNLADSPRSVSLATMELKEQRFDQEQDGLRVDSRSDRIWFACEILRNIPSYVTDFNAGPEAFSLVVLKDVTDEDLEYLALMVNAWCEGVPDMPAAWLANWKMHESDANQRLSLLAVAMKARTSKLCPALAIVTPNANEEEIYESALDSCGCR